jgi:nickel-dependent lactate racemase
VLFSTGSKTAVLGEADIRRIVTEAFEQIRLDGKRVLVIIPDHSRSGPTGLFFRAVADALLPRVSRLDFLVALGTHPPLSEEKIDALLQFAPGERAAKYGRVAVLNHHWNDPGELQSVGTISARRLSELSNGMMSQDVPVLLNRHIFDYDHFLICGPVFPHEVAGFSGGHKYLFPGIAAPQIINATHWLGALITNPAIIGVRDTPVRAVIEEAAAMVPIERHGIAYVVDPEALRGIFIGPVSDAWQRAAALSDQVHIQYHARPYHTVLSCAPKMYDDIWTAGKCMYKLEPAVADDGTLIIYAPHITEVSVMHGKVIEEVGYHCRDFFVKQWDKYRGYPWGVLAHCTHVKGTGTCENGVERPRVNVVLATRIPPERCRKINLGYMDPDKINPADYANREAEGVFYVPKAGEILHRIR